MRAGSADPVRRIPRSRYIYVALSVALMMVKLTALGSAQLTAAVDGGGSRITYADAGGLSAGSVSPTIEWLTPSASVTATGSFARFTDGSWSLQGTMASSVFTPSVAKVRGEFAAVAIGSTHQDGGNAGDLLGRGRLHWLDAHGGGWIGIAVGQAWNGIQWQRDRRGDVGAWFRHTTLTLTATAAPIWLSDSLRFLDADATARWTPGSVEITAFGGFRHWSRPTVTAGSTWGGSSVALWFSPHLAMVAAGGSYPADYAQGLPGGTYVSLGIRLASRRPGHDLSYSADARRSAMVANSVLPIDPRRLVPVASALEVRAPDPGNADHYTFSLHAPAAHQVELMGDFTQWQPVTLTQTLNGSWSITLAAEPGIYRMNVRVDGGLWGVPAGLPAVVDDFGGLVGVLKIEAP